MSLVQIIVFISGFSFLAYGIAYFASSNMKNEFRRFGLEKFGALTAVLELLGAAGLLLGLVVKSVLLFSSGGLAVLMFLGVLVRIKIKDTIWMLLPALFYMILNAYIFFVSLK
jgi:hypothetical protein